MTTPNMTLDCDGFADALADYLEGDAPEVVRAAVDAHAESCAACRQLLADLTGMRVEAAALPALTPSRDLWAGIAERIDTPVLPMDVARTAAATSVRRSWARPAVAAAALVVLTAGITYYLTRASLVRSAAPSQVAAAVATPAVTQTDAAPAGVTLPVSEPVAEVTSVAGASGVRRPAQRATVAVSTPARLASTNPALSQVDSVFAGEIKSLRQMLRVRRAELDPSTVAVLEQSIAVIDSAIAQSRAALLKDPASGFLASQLSHSLEKKVELLRTAALLPSRT